MKPIKLTFVISIILLVALLIINAFVHLTGRSIGEMIYGSGEGQHHDAMMFDLDFWSFCSILFWVLILTAFVTGAIWLIKRVAKSS